MGKVNGLKNKGFIDIDKDLLYEDYVKNQMTLIKMGEKYHCSRNTIRNRLLELGIVIRDTGRRRNVK